MGKQKTQNIVSSKQVAGLYQPTFRVNEGINLASIQINVSETCLSVASLVCECISLTSNSYTEPCHGYATGLKGVLAAVIGCAAVVPSACISVCCDSFTLACHGLTEGERGVFTTSCTLPTGICACTNYYVIVISSSVFKVAASRANAIAACPVPVDVAGAGVGNQTFTPNGAIPTGAAACSWIIKVDCDTFKLATSKANAQAETCDPITALNSPASITFTPTATACDCGNGTISFHASNDYANYEAANLGSFCYKLNPCGVVNTIYKFSDVSYNEIQIDVCVTEGQWTIDIDAVGKEP